MKLSKILSAAGRPYTLVRDGDFSVLELCSRIRAKQALTFLESEKYTLCLETPDISCVICTPALQSLVPAHVEGLVLAERPKALFYTIHNLLTEKREHRPSVIDPSARISPLAYISPYNVVIGKNVEIEPFAMIGENTVIKDDVRICAGALVGSRSFVPVPDGDTMFLAKDAGSTLIEEGVEICGHCNIACGTLQLDTTTIGAYSKLDAMVHIGHGTVLGKRNRIPSGVQIAGSCVIGDDIWIGVNATVSNRVKIGDGARVSLGSVVVKNVPAGETVTGNFAIPHLAFLQNIKRSLKKNTTGGQLPPPGGQFGNS